MMIQFELTSLDRAESTDISPNPDVPQGPGHVLTLAIEQCVVAERKLRDAKQAADEADRLVVEAITRRQEAMRKVAEIQSENDHAQRNLDHAIMFYTQPLAAEQLYP